MTAAFFRGLFFFAYSSPTDSRQLCSNHVCLGFNLRSFSLIFVFILFSFPLYKADPQSCLAWAMFYILGNDRNNLNCPCMPGLWALFKYHISLKIFDMHSLAQWRWGDQKNKHLGTTLARKVDTEDMGRRRNEQKNMSWSAADTKRMTSTCEWTITWPIHEP